MKTSAAMRFGCIAMALSMGCVTSSQFIETTQLYNLERGPMVEDTRGDPLDLSTEDELRVMLRGDREIVVSRFEVHGGILIGKLRNGEVAVVPLAIVDYARVRHPNPAGIVGVVIGGLAAVALVVLMIWAASHPYYGGY
jgi:hypothetical protein